MTDAAEFSIEDANHLEMFCGLLLDVEDGGMTVVAVKPLNVRLVREDRGRDSGPLGLKRQILPEGHSFRRFDGEKMLGADSS